METSKKIYLDANIFLCANNPFEMGHEDAVLLFDKIDASFFSACTSTLTVDEVVFISQKVGGKYHAIESGRNILENAWIEMIPATKEILHSALHIMEKTNLDPRDAIHLASALHVHAALFVTLDSDFASLKEIKIISPKEALRLL